MERDSNNLFPWSTLGIAAASAAATYAAIHFIEKKNRVLRYHVEDHATRQYENPAFLQSPETQQTQVSTRRADPYDPKPRSEYVVHIMSCVCWFVVVTIGCVL